MAKYFKHPEDITVSELQMMSISLNRSMDYQIALRVVRDELQGHKKENRYWLAKRDKVWKYFSTTFKDLLGNHEIHNIDDLIGRTVAHFSLK